MKYTKTNEDKCVSDEIVRALRICNKPKGYRCSECPIFSRYDYRICKATVDKAAADLIESLQAENATLRKLQSVSLSGDAAHSFSLAMELAETKAQLAASQARERAAVEDIYEIELSHICAVCEYRAKDTDLMCSDCTGQSVDVGNFTWRGLRMRRGKGMTDRISEIRARWEHPQWGMKYKDIALHAESDIPYLLDRLAEAEEELKQADDYIGTYKDICDKHMEMNRKLIAEVKRLREAISGIVWEWDNGHIEPYSPYVRDYIDQLRLLPAPPEEGESK